jgi:hypothetical protein
MKPSSAPQPVPFKRKFRRCALMSFLTVVALLIGIWCYEHAYFAQAVPPSVEMWPVESTNIGFTDPKHQSFVVSNASPFVVIPSEIYTVEVRTTSGEPIVVPGSFPEKPRPLRPHESQAVIAYPYVSDDQTLSRVTLVSYRDENFLIANLRKVRVALSQMGFPVVVYRLEKCRAQSGWVQKPGAERL